MAERKTIATISVITDSETSYDNIGDVGGGFSTDELKSHIEKYGHENLCAQLSYLNFQVWQTLRQVNAERNSKEGAQAVKSND